MSPYNASPWWTPIGDFTNRFDAKFRGNGHTIDNLRVEVAGDFAGLFGALGTSAEVRSLVLTDASVTVKPTSSTDGAENAGVLAGYSAGTVVDVHAAGAVQAVPNLGSGFASRIGGLVGEVASGGEVRASHAAVTVSAGEQGTSVGGLAGVNGGAVKASYASGNVTGRLGVGGLVGASGDSGSIIASYAIGKVVGSGTFPDREGGLLGEKKMGTVTASYYNKDTAEQSDEDKGDGKTTAALTAPTGYTGIYAGWNLDLDGDGNKDEPWDFGAAGQYPGLEDAMGNVHRPVTPSVVQAFGDPAPGVDSDLDGNADAYVKDDAFSVWLKFDAAVTVANPGTGGANAQVVVAVDSTDYTLNYLESDDTDTRLKFGTHTVVAGDGDSDGIAVKRDSSDKLVRLSGTATMTSSAGTDANLKAGADLNIRAAVDSEVTVVKVRGTNAAPVGQDFTVTTGRNRDLTLARTGFKFTDTDDDPLKEIQVVTLPDGAHGALELDGTAIASGDLPKTVTRAELDQDKVVFDPATDYVGDATFTFKVVDSFDDADASARTATITVRPGPVLLRATVDGGTVRLLYDLALDANSVPAASAFTVKVGGSAVSLANATPVAVSGKTATLTLAAAVSLTDKVTVSYVRPSANPIQDSNGDDAEDFTDRAAVNVTGDRTPPAFDYAFANGAGIVVVFDEAPDEYSLPAAGSFTYTRNGVAATPEVITISVPLRPGGAAQRAAGVHCRADGDGELRQAQRRSPPGPGPQRGGQLHQPDRDQCHRGHHSAHAVRRGGGRGHADPDLQRAAGRVLGSGGDGLHGEGERQRGEPGGGQSGGDGGHGHDGYPHPGDGDHPGPAGDGELYGGDRPHRGPGRQRRRRPGGPGDRQRPASAAQRGGG